MEHGDALIPSEFRNDQNIQSIKDAQQQKGCRTVLNSKWRTWRLLLYGMGQNVTFVTVSAVSRWKGRVAMTERGELVAPGLSAATGLLSSGCREFKRGQGGPSREPRKRHQNKSVAGVMCTRVCYCDRQSTNKLATQKLMTKSIRMLGVEKGFHQVFYFPIPP